MAAKNLNLAKFSSNNHNAKLHVRNYEVYWIHRIFLMIYIIGLSLLGIGMLKKFDLNAVMAFLIVLALFAWMLYLHYVAACESAQGTTRGRNISQLIALILLFFFPVGTVIAIYLFYLTSQFKWQKSL